MGIVAMDKKDGTVYQARNLDLSPVDTLGALVYPAVFQKDGKGVFRSQMIMGYIGIITAAKGLGE
jgi:hypothetical protein